jgi:hypothetical protein
MIKWWVGWLGEKRKNHWQQSAYHATFARTVVVSGSARPRFPPVVVMPLAVFVDSVGRDTVPHQHAQSRGGFEHVVDPLSFQS